MSGTGKLVVAAGIAAVGIGAAVYSAMSMQRRPAPVSRRDVGGVRAVERGGSGGAEGNGLDIRVSPETASRLGMTPEQVSERVGELSREGKSPEEIAKELGLPAGGMRITRSGGPMGGEGGPEIDPPPAGPFAFERPSSAARAAEIEGAMEDRVQEAAAGVEGVDPKRGDPEDLGKAARLALVSPARGRAEFAAAVMELGGVVGSDGGLTGSAEGIAGLLEGAWIDVGSLRVKRGVLDEGMPMGMAPPPPSGAGEEGGMRMMTRVMRMRGDGDVETELATTTMPVGDVWPRTVDEVEDGAVAVEVKCAVKLGGLDVKEGWSELGVVMVRERETRMWQPVSYTLYCRDEKAVTRFLRATAEARRNAGAK